jgi:hypothetical protein
MTEIKELNIMTDPHLLDDFIGQATKLTCEAQNLTARPAGNTSYSPVPNLRAGIDAS